MDPDGTDPTSAEVEDTSSTGEESSRSNQLELLLSTEEFLNGPEESTSAEESGDQEELDQPEEESPELLEEELSEEELSLEMSEDTEERSSLSEENTSLLQEVEELLSEEESLDTKLSREEEDSLLVTSEDTES